MEKEYCGWCIGVSIWGLWTCSVQMIWLKIHLYSFSFLCQKLDLTYTGHTSKHYRTSHISMDPQPKLVKRQKYTLNKILVHHKLLCTPTFLHSFTPWAFYLLVRFLHFGKKLKHLEEIHITIKNNMCNTSRHSSRTKLRIIDL